MGAERDRCKSIHELGGIVRLVSLTTRDYRTLESLDLPFPSVYAAVCGANDSGKTNVVRAIRALVGGDVFDPYSMTDDWELSFKDDYPKWKTVEPSEREILIKVTIELDEARDIGFYEFVTTQLALANPDNPLVLSISATFRADRAGPSVTVETGGETFTGMSAQQVLRKLQSSRCVLVHNSTETERGYLYSGGRVAGHIREITGQHEALVEDMKKKVNRGLAKISRSQQEELESLLGRLKTKYKVGLSMPAFDFGYLPYSITLGDKKMEIPLDDWGSGTRNRTLIVLTLFRAREVADSEASASKIAPVIVIEEPESFLHPSAQAEFGRVLQDLAAEFQVQVIVTTHSPYLLNLHDAESNVLLNRRTAYRQLRETERVDTSGENWMAPFGQALGLDDEEFRPWRGMLLSDSDGILLVEGETDKKYLEMLRDPAHGSHQLVFSGDIVAYDGTGNLSNSVLLRFIRNRFNRFFVTYDLDAASHVERTLRALKLEEGKDYLAIGVDAPGKKNIEGLLPDIVTSAVYNAHPDVVQAATAGTRDEQDDAKRKLKKLLLQEFKNQASPGTEYFGGFYSLCDAINRALAG